jgi:hypothetical protein
MVNTPTGMHEEFKMNALKKQPAYSNDSEKLPHHYDSLPGQQQLFLENEQQNLPSIESAPKSNDELFYTGKDLPGTKETLQAILWDVH